MIASAIADSISRWCRSATRWRAPTNLTVSRPAAVLSRRCNAGGVVAAWNAACRLAT
jgi:hypothetical protein